MQNLAGQHREEACSPRVWCKLELDCWPPPAGGAETPSGVLCSGLLVMTHFGGRERGLDPISEPLGGEHRKGSRVEFFREGEHRPLIPTSYKFPDETSQPIISLLQTGTSPSSRLCRRNPLFSQITSAPHC